VIRLRRSFRALSGPNVNVFHVNNSCRLIAFHRWLDGSGEDIVVVGALSEGNLHNYEIGFRHGGAWREVFNSDYFESSPGHQTTGNGGTVYASGLPMHGFSASARVTIPANGVLVFTR